MRYPLLTLALVVGLAACSEDAALTGPADSPAESPAGAAEHPMDDVLTRIAPALGEGSLADALRADLRRVRDGGSADAIEPELRQLEEEDPSLAADLDAIRLVLGTMD
jgi:hypothetical protein